MFSRDGTHDISVEKLIAAGNKTNDALVVVVVGLVNEAVEGCRNRSISCSILFDYPAKKRKNKCNIIISCSVFGQVWCTCPRSSCARRAGGARGRRGRRGAAARRRPTCTPSRCCCTSCTRGAGPSAPTRRRCPRCCAASRTRSPRPTGRYVSRAHTAHSAQLYWHDAE